MSEKRASEWARTYIDNVEIIEKEIKRHDVGDQDPDTTKAVCELLLDYKAENAKLSKMVTDKAIREMQDLDEIELLKNENAKLKEQLEKAIEQRDYWIKQHCSCIRHDSEYHIKVRNDEIEGVGE